MRNAPARVSGAAAGVEEELRAVPAVEVRAAHGEVAAQRLGGRAAERHDPLLAALAERAHEPALDVHRGPVEADRLGDAQAGAVEQLDERAVAHRPRRHADGGVDQALDLGGGERARQPARAPGELQVGGGVVGARPEQELVPEEGADGGDAAGDRRRREAVGAELGDPALELVVGRRRDRSAAPGGERREVAPVRLDGPRRALRGEQGEEAFDLVVADGRHGRSRFAGAAPGSCARRSGAGVRSGRRRGAAGGASTWL